MWHLLTLFRHSIKAAVDWKKPLTMAGTGFEVFFTEISAIKQTQYLIVMLGKLWPTLSVRTVKDGVSIIDSVRFLVCLSSVILIGHDHRPSLSLFSHFSLLVRKMAGLGPMHRCLQNLAELTLSNELVGLVLFLIKNLFIIAPFLVLGLGIMLMFLHSCLTHVLHGVLCHFQVQCSILFS